MVKALKYMKNCGLKGTARLLHPLSHIPNRIVDKGLGFINVYLYTVMITGIVHLLIVGML